MRYFILIFTVFWASVAGAQTLPSHSGGYVNDFANVFLTRREADLENTVRDLKTASGVELAVVTIKSLATYDAGPGIENFSTSLFNSWGIGDKTRNDGILLLIAVDDHKMRIELGKGFPPRADGVAASIIADTLRPAFKAGDMSGGITKGVAEISSRIVPLAGKPRQVSSTKSGPGGIGIGLIAFFAVFVFLVWKVAKKLGLVGSRKCPECHQRTIEHASEVVKKPTKTTKGEKKVTSTCSNCGHTTTNLIIMGLIGSSAMANTGGGDFGGGSSSGGGASGDW